jgi:hypothetical protein
MQKQVVMNGRDLKNRPLTLALSHPMGEGMAERAQGQACTVEFLKPPVSAKKTLRLDSCGGGQISSLSHRMGEGRGEGPAL